MHFWLSMHHIQNQVRLFNKYWFCTDSFSKKSIYNVGNKNQSHDRIGWHKFSSAFGVTNAQFGKMASYECVCVFIAMAPERQNQFSPRTYLSRCRHWRCTRKCQKRMRLRRTPWCSQCSDHSLKNVPCESARRPNRNHRWKVGQLSYPRCS